MNTQEVAVSKCNSNVQSCDNNDRHDDYGKKTTYLKKAFISG